MRPLKLLAVVLAMFVIGQSTVLAQARGVYVNDVQLDAGTLLAIQMTYRTAIPAGSYWYDPYSGLWGRSGGPTLGRIYAGLRLGGQLRIDASNGDTWVFVNGRRLPRAELYALQQLVGAVQPGRYWLDAHGNAGYEGGPALVNLLAAHQQRMSNGWNRNTQGGAWGGDGDCSYYSHPDGPSVMIGNC